MGRPGTWEIPRSPPEDTVTVHGMETDQALADSPTTRERTWRQQVGPGSESISGREQTWEVVALS